jgi:hypothetical protein
LTKIAVGGVGLLFDFGREYSICFLDFLEIRGIEVVPNQQRFVVLRGGIGQGTQTVDILVDVAGGDGLLEGDRRETDGAVVTILHCGLVGL